MRSEMPGVSNMVCCLSEEIMSYIEVNINDDCMVHATAVWRDAHLSSH